VPPVTGSATLPRVPVFRIGVESMRSSGGSLRAMALAVLMPVFGAFRSSSTPIPRWRE